ncbi:hypothetical protein Maut_01031 [Moorella thermoacetica]|uniref:Uncharacterized protein n=1 Tax=Neomoorella thermoacetica TaxID=1525 RepID=A0AAC9HGN9_NEOTH|nr:hypothetical protein Maut_01031 [Moorella thermoacetica]
MFPAQLFPQVFDMGIYRPQVTVKIVAPDLFQNLFPAHDLPGVAGQEKEEIELLGRQVAYGAAVDLNLPGGNVDY